MTSIRTNCPRCGEVEMRADTILLLLDKERGDEGYYRFICPVCEDQVDQPADRKIVSLLKSCGVKPQEIEKIEPSAHEDGPPIVIDDVVDFHFLLAQDDWFERLASPPS